MRQRAPVKASGAPPPHARAWPWVLLCAALLGVSGLVHACRVLWARELLHLKPTIHHHLRQAPRDCATFRRDPAYAHEDGCHAQDEVQTILRELVLTLSGVLAAHNVTYFLDSGTLLGAYRDQRVIPHDDDADVGIDPGGLEYLRHRRLEFPATYDFTVWNSPLYPNSTRDAQLPARLIHRASGIYVDVFAFLNWPRGLVGPLPSGSFANCVGCPSSSTKNDGGDGAGGDRTLRVPRRWLYPVVDCVFEGHVLKCPRETRTYLRYIYGSNFMVPIKNS